MKKLFLSLLLLFSATLMYAQAPDAFNYQAVARNNAGAVLPNQAVAVRLSIHTGTSVGTVVYSERQTATTNLFGLFSVTIGAGGTILSGTFSTVDWAGALKYLQVELDPAGGTTYTDMGTTQLISVPYAKTANSLNLFATGTSNPTKMIISHSPAWQSYGLQYMDSSDQFNFIGANQPVLTVHLGSYSVGVGTLTPSSKLDVNGTVTISGGSASELNRTPTTDANLIPIAYGNINADGTINVAATTANVSLASHSAGSGIYYLNIASESIFYTSNTAIVSLNGSTKGFVVWNSASGNLYVGTANSAGAAADIAFTFVLYKK